MKHWMRLLTWWAFGQGRSNWGACRRRRAWKPWTESLQTGTTRAPRTRGRMALFWQKRCRRHPINPRNFINNAISFKKNYTDLNGIFERANPFVPEYCNVEDLILTCTWHFELVCCCPRERTLTFVNVTNHSSQLHFGFLWLIWLLEPLNT